MCSVIQLPGPGKNSWEYRVFTENSSEIVDKLATVRLAGRVADKLSAAGIIGKSVTELAHNYGPGITETSRVRDIITVLKDKIQLDARRYHDFRKVLLSLDADADTALHYMPEKGGVIFLVNLSLKLESFKRNFDLTLLVNAFSIHRSNSP